MQVDEQLSRVIQPLELTARHAVAAVVVVEAVEGPLVLEPEAPHDALDERGCHRRAVVLFALHQHRRRARVGLDVVRLVPEPRQADEVVHRLPDDAGNGYTSHHPEQDDLLARPCEQAHLQRFTGLLLKRSLRRRPTVGIRRERWFAPRLIAVRGTGMSVGLGQVPVARRRGLAVSGLTVFHLLLKRGRVAAVGERCANPLANGACEAVDHLALDSRTVPCAVRDGGHLSGLHTLQVVGLDLRDLSVLGLVELVVQAAGHE